RDSLQEKEVILEKLSDYRLIFNKNKIRIHTSEETNLKEFIDIFNELGFEVYEARQIRPSLEDVFVEITGIELKEMEEEKKNGGRA
ncbi:MAG: hypothetical protein ACLFUI_01110, partial [Halanaerobiales bacterium]